MAVKSSKVGAILGLIGSTIMLIGGLAYLSISRVAYYPVPYIPPFLPYITATVTISLSAFGLTGSLLVFRDLRWG